MKEKNEVKPQVNKVGAQEEGKSLKVKEVVLTNRDHDVRVMVRPTLEFMYSTMPKQHIFGCMPGCNKVEFSNQFKEFKDRIKEVYKTADITGITSCAKAIGTGGYYILFDYIIYGEEDEIVMKLFDPEGALVFSVSKVSEDSEDLDIDELILAWMTVWPVLEEALIQNYTDDIYKWIIRAGSK